MIREQDHRRVGKARLLRRQGKSYDEIRDVIGAVGDDALKHWLKGIPRPASTYRSRAKDDLRLQARRLRGEGLTYDEIAEITGASQGSLSLWLRDMPREFEHSEERRLARFRATYAQIRAQKDEVREAEIAAVAARIGAVTDRELLLVGVALYWAEGSKSKPWRRNERIIFINSDPSVIVTFVRWLELMGVRDQDIKFRVSIHETANVAAAQQYWSEVVGADATRFHRPTIKRHNPKTTRYNIGNGYRGCLTISVRKSADLYRRVEGSWRGLSAGISAKDRVDTRRLGIDSVPSSVPARTADFDSARRGPTPLSGALHQ